MVVDIIFRNSCGLRKKKGCCGEIPGSRKLDRRWTLKHMKCNGFDEC
jgi:hypothetical protein